MEADETFDLEYRRYTEDELTEVNLLALELKGLIDANWLKAPELVDVQVSRRIKEIHEQIHSKGFKMEKKLEIVIPRDDPFNMVLDSEITLYYRVEDEMVH